MKLAAAMLSAAGALALVVNAAFQVSFTSSHLMVALAGLLLVYAGISPRLLFCREIALYSAFVAYLFIQLSWTQDINLALNTLFPAVDFVLIMIFFGSLISYQDVRAVMMGMLVGFVVGAVAYTNSVGFPFVHPPGFSYNAIAAMYLFGSFVALVFACLSRWKLLVLLVALVLVMHVAATTSIKTNLGILLSAGGAGLMYFRQSVQLFRRNAFYLLIVVGVLAFAVASNDVVLERLEAGMARLAIGVEVLQTRDDVDGYGGYAERQYWMLQGLRGWVANPLFGYGVEAFRHDYGITSHSTPIDLLYNTGMIGLGLFYSVFVSIAWRLFNSRDKNTRIVRALLFAALLCNLFITLSATVFYQSFIAATAAISIALLRRFDSEHVASSQANRTLENVSD
jgi:hypothetical protein